MSDSFHALCTDFYVNQKVALKMDLPTRRETVLDMFDRIRRELPAMDRFRRYEGELALESPEDEARYSWIALRQTSIRSGFVNPLNLGEAYRLHQLILELSPYFLSISSLDIDYLELIFGFDLAASGNRDEVVFEALLANSPLEGLLGRERESVIDAQPYLGFALDSSRQLHAYVEIKTHGASDDGAEDSISERPISVYLTIRRLGPLGSVKDLPGIFGTLAGHAERLAEERVIPSVVMPIRERIHT